MHPNQLTKSDFTQRAVSVHAGKFSYENVEYVNSHTPVLITCSVHGDFQQKPFSHLAGKGCGQCAGTARGTTRAFVQQARKTHGLRYDYSRARYKNNKTKVAIVCKSHGEFLQAPNSHLSGRGCPGCAKGAYKPHRPGYVYVLLSECGQFVKVGLTNAPRRRLSELRTHTPFMFVVLAVYPLAGRVAPQVEKWAQTEGESARLSGFEGATEWLSYSLDFEYVVHCVATQAQAA